MTDADPGWPSSDADTIVLGAGVAGLTAAKTLSDAGHRVIVVDKAEVPGGAHRSRNIGGYTFDVGSIFFESRSPLFDLFPDLRAECPEVRRRQQRITPAGTLAHYPFEAAEILGWSWRARLAIARELSLRAFRRRVPETVDELCRARLGKTIYTASGLEAYITRFHQEPPSAIGTEFFFRRMGFVGRGAGLGGILSEARRMVLGQTARKGPPLPLRVRPVQGFDRFYAVVARQLRAQGVAFMLDGEITRVGRTDMGFEVIAGGIRLTAARIVSAIPIVELHRLVFGAALALESLDLLTLFVSCPKGSPVSGNVLFNFHGSGRWKRLTRYSEIYTDHPGAGLRRDRDFFSVEITLPHGTAPEPEVAFADFVGHVSGLNLFPPELSLEGFEVVEDAYPIYRPGASAVVAAALDRLTRFGIISVGRQGRFEYLPVSSLVIHQTRRELAAHNLLPDHSGTSPTNAGGVPPTVGREGVSRKRGGIV